jgi:hypothetical protein
MSPIQVYDRKRTRKEWIDYLTLCRVVPIWKGENQVIFKRLEKQYDSKHEFTRKEGLQIRLELGITSREMCDEIRKEILNKIKSSNV